MTENLPKSCQQKQLYDQVSFNLLSHLPYILEPLTYFSMFQFPSQTPAWQTSTFFLVVKIRHESPERINTISESRDRIWALYVYVLYLKSSFRVKQCRQAAFESTLLMIKDPCLSCFLKKISKWLTETCLTEASFLQIKGYKVNMVRHRALEIVKLLLLVRTD